MRDYFFQIILFLAGAVIGIAVPLLPKPGQKWIAGILAILLIITSLIWVGYEIGRIDGTPAIATDIAPDDVDQPTPTPTTTIDAGPTVHDDFNDPSFEGDINPNLWIRNLPAICKVAQREGVMVFENTPPSSYTDCILYVKPNPISVNDLNMFEASIKLANDHSGGHLSQGIELTPVGREGWMTIFCGLMAQDGVVASRFEIYTEKGAEISQEKFADYDRWYTFRLELEPQTMRFECYADDNLIGSIIPQEADSLKNLHFSRYLLGTRTEGSQATGYVDNVRTSTDK